MIAPSDSYVAWDAAYVLGALSPDDRRDFELHLGGCEACSRAVAELAGLPGLLAAVPLEQALVGEVSSGEGSGDNGRLPGLLAAARREQSRSRGLLVSALVGVAVLTAIVALAVTGWVGLAGMPGQGPVAEPTASAPAATLTMRQVVPSPLSADLRLEVLPWGTQINTRCSYAQQVEGSTGARGYALYVTDKNGEASLVASWIAAPGTTVTPVGTTSLTAADIATVDIRSVSSGQVLLESRLEP